MYTRMYLLLILMTVSGCAGPDARPTATVLGTERTNLALGEFRGHAQWGEALAYRSDWPAVEHGYRFGETSEYFDFQFDDQSFFDRRGGGYFSQQTAYRSGVFIRP